MKKYYNAHTLWAVMMVLTLSTYSIAKLGFSGTYVVLFLLATAVVKGSIIIGDFMEVRGTSLLWRVIMYGWLWLIAITIAFTYMIGS